MTITDQLVRLMGGEIVVDSAPGKGSGFHRVPASAGGGAGRRDGGSAGRDGKTALR